MSDLDLDELRDELAEFARPAKTVGRSAREERVIAGFEEIQRFVEQHERAPQHGEDRDIFERLYAVRLDRLRALDECRALLTPFDKKGLLTAEPAVAALLEDIDLDDLAAELEGGAGGETDARLRVVYSNGTESNLLLRSLQRALYKDEAGRRITEGEAGPLFAERAGDEDQESGTIYVLRSRSDHPLVAANREVLHKIGVTGGTWRAALRTLGSTPPSSWPMSRSSPPTRSTTSIEQNLRS